MKFKRIGRVLVCLLLVSALLINASPIKAKATGIGATAAITAASTVLTPAGLVVGATFVALGLAAAANPEGFQNIVDAGVSALESAGTWVKDGMVELLRTEDADGNVSYYVDSGLMDDVFQWSYLENIITAALPGAKYYPANSNVFSDPYSSDTYDYPVYRIIFDRKSYTDQLLTVCAVAGATLTRVTSSGTKQIFSPSDNGYAIAVQTGYFDYDYLVNSGVPVVHESTSYSMYSAVINDFLSGTLDGDSEYFSSYDITLGSLPAQTSDLTDGTSARQWSEEYTDRGLKVYGGGSGNNNNDGKWFWKVMIPLTAVDLLAMSQADAWAGNTPQEFDDYDTKEELKVMDTPEVEFGFGIVLEPDSGDSSGSDDPTESTEPTTPGGLPDIGGGDNPDPGGDGNTGTESGNQTDYTNWFERIIKGIEELPSKFAEWFNNIASQLERIIEGITTLGQNFAQSLQTLGQNIVEGFRNAISSLFSPSENYLENKVQALKDKHYNLAQFTELGNNLKAFFAGLGSKPPIIYIDLGAATGSYLWGGRQIFLDLTWYAEYKPKMDFILGGIIWLWLAWRVFLAIPGIISGMPGESGSPDISIGTHYIPPIPGQGALPPGQKKRRSK